MTEICHENVTKLQSKWQEWHAKLSEAMKSRSHWPKITFRYITLAVMFAFLMVPGKSALAQSWKSTNILGNWTSVAVSGSGSDIAAAAFLGSIYTSTNGGTNWISAGALEPDRPVLAASENGSNLVMAYFDGNIYTSPDWGANTNWVESAAPVEPWNCLAISGDGSRVVAGTYPGLIYASTNGGETWAQSSAPYDFWQSVASSASGSNLLAASHSGYVYESTNAGITWNELAIDVGGTNVIASDMLYLSVIYTNLNPTEVNTNQFITNLYNPILTIPATAVSSNNIVVSDGVALGLTGFNATGTNIMAVDLAVDVQGSNVLDVNPLITDALGRVGSAGPISIANPYLANLAIPNGTGVFDTNGVLNTNLITVLNTNISGISLFVTNVLNVEVAIGNLPQSWSAVASSADGSHLAACVNGGGIYTSTDYGVTWTVANVPITNWLDVAISADGYYLTAVANNGTNGLRYTSSNGGLNWVGTNVPSVKLSGIALSGDGSVQAAVAYPGGIYYVHQVVTPPVPKIVSITRGSGNTSVYFTTVSGATYTLYYTNTTGLATFVTNWPSASSLTGDGGTDHLSDGAIDASRFYRVVAHH